MVSRSSAGLHVQKTFTGEGEEGRQGRKGGRGGASLPRCGAARAALCAADVTSGFEITNNAAFLSCSRFRTRSSRPAPAAGRRASHSHWGSSSPVSLLLPPVRDKRKAPQIAKSHRCTPLAPRLHLRSTNRETADALR